MSDSDEKLIFDGLDLNDEAGPFIVEGFNFKQAQKKVKWAENSDADGDALVDEAHYTNAFFEAMRIRVVTQKDMDTALARLGELTDKLQKAERMAAVGGLPLPWTPAESTKTWTWYVLLGEYEEIPITPTGDLAGWFIRSPIVTVKLSCRPFGHGKETQVLAPVSSTLPLQTAVLADPGGDVPAEARIVVTDKAGQDRRHAEIGLEQLDKEGSAPALTIDSDSMVVTGFAGAQATRAGSYDPNASGNNVIRTTAISTPVVACSTGPIANIGSFREKLRIYALSEDLRVRASYKVGDGPFESLDWQRPVAINAFSEIDLGEATFDRLVKGNQASEVRIEVKSVGAKTEADIDFLNFLPTGRGYAKVRGLASNDLTSLIAYDEADQAPGNLTGGYTTNGITAITAANPGVITCTGHGLSNGDRVWIEGIKGTVGEVLTGFFTVAGVATNTFNVGVNTTGKSYTSGGKVSKGGQLLPFPNTKKWFGVGDVDDAAVNGTAHTFDRTATSDASKGGGRYFIPDLAPVVAARVGITVSANATGEADLRRGCFVRFKDSSNWLMVALERLGGLPPFSNSVAFRCIKCVGGVETVLHSTLGGSQLTPARLELQVDASGLWQIWGASNPSGVVQGPPAFTGQDADLATAGALASGQIGWYDAWTPATAATRSFDQFNALTVAEPGRVCYANRIAEARADVDWLREDADGGDWGAPSIYRGGNFHLPPAGDTEAVTRLAVKLRRGDTDTEADLFITDKHQLEVLATPRVLLPR